MVVLKWRLIFGRFPKVQFGHFRQCIDSKKSPLVSGEDAKRVVEIILAAKKSARKGITVRV